MHFRHSIHGLTLNELNALVLLAEAALTQHCDDDLERVHQKLVYARDNGAAQEAYVALREDPWNELPETLGLKPQAWQTPANDASDPRTETR